MSYTYISSGNDITITGWTGGTINKQFDEDIGLTGRIIKTIANNAFYNKGYTFALAGLVLPNTLTTIGANAYHKATGINGTINLSETNLTSIGNKAFFGCNALTGILSFPPSLNYIGSASFELCTGLSGELDLSNLTQLSNLYGSTFAQCRFSSLKLPLNLIALGGFENCAQLSGNLDLSALTQLTTLYQNAFLFCSNYTGSLTLPSSLNNLGTSGTFYRCNFTGVLDLSNTSITAIPGDNFYDCNFNTLILPSLTFIGNASFLSVPLSSLYFQSGCTLQTNSFSRSTTAIVYAYQGNRFTIGSASGSFSNSINPLTSFFSRWRLYNQPYPTTDTFFSSSTNTFYKEFVPGTDFTFYTYNVNIVTYSVVVKDANGIVIETIPTTSVPVGYLYTFTVQLQNGSKTITLNDSSLVLNLIELECSSFGDLNDSYNIGETMNITWSGTNPPYLLLLSGSGIRPITIDSNFYGNSIDYVIPTLPPLSYEITIVNDNNCQTISKSFDLNPCITITQMNAYYYDFITVNWIGFSTFYTVSLVGLDGSETFMATTSATTLIWPITSILPGLYQIQVSSGNDCSVLSNTFLIVTLQDICFVKDTLVETDQGDIPIQSIIPGKHTVFNQKIIDVTKTIHPDSHLVHIKAFSFGTYPNKDTTVSQEHKINGINSFREARHYVNDSTITLVPYDFQPLYNVLLIRPGFMRVHGMMVETLDPYVMKHQPKRQMLKK